MQSFFTFEGILAATSISYLLGSVWYSPALFMNEWLMSQGYTKETMPQHEKRYMIQVMLYSFLAHGCIATVLALILSLVGVTTLILALVVTLLLGFGFIVPVKFMEMLYSLSAKHYEKKSQVRFLVDTGYLLVVMCTMTTVLFFFV